MKKSISIILLFIFICLITFKVTSNEENPHFDFILSKQDSIPFLDTIINLKNIKISSYKGRNLTNIIAKNILYKHFKRKGYFVETQFVNGYPVNSDTLIEQVECVYFDKIYKINLNNNKYSDAIISYWINLPYASSNCLQPKKAIIIDTDSGYKITNEDFIPENYYIDSVVKKENQSIIFGYEYDCNEHIAIRNLRIKLK
ncbi:MAG: hypothetical protein ACOYLE_10950 [Bacteroidales bacterium]